MRQRRPRHTHTTRLLCACARPSGLFPVVVVQDACNSNASFDLTTEQLLSAISEMERAQEVVKVGQQSRPQSRAFYLPTDLRLT